jgi:hypothetical protein
MPLMWLWAHVESMPGLQAEEAFRLAEIIAVGAVKMGKDGRDKVVRRWNNARNGKGVSSEAEFAKMGIGIRRVPKLGKGMNIGSR